MSNGASRAVLLNETFDSGKKFHKYDTIASSDLNRGKDNGNKFALANDQGNDGWLNFNTVSLAGYDHAQVSLDIAAFGGFENSGGARDYLKIVIEDGDGNVLIEDEFTATGGENWRSDTGQEIGGDFQTVSYDVPNGVDGVKIRVLADTSTKKEEIRIDNVAVTAVESDGVPTLGDDDPAPSTDVLGDGEICVEFDDIATGTILGADDTAGATIRAYTIQDLNNGGGLTNRAMVFDTENVTGGDTDLASDTLGKVLIISEDGDTSDPDDNAKGGLIEIDFDAEVAFEDVTIFDTEEGGTITLFGADGTVLATFEIPEVDDGEIQTLSLDTAGVTRAEIFFDGSGAIDDICFTPVQTTPPPDEIGDGKVCETFETDADGTALVAGDGLGELVFEGVTFKAIRSQDDDGVFDDVMIFDSDNPTGGDDDLGQDGMGNVIIISEDGDRSDPDDNARGGQIVATFDVPSTVSEVTILDTESRNGATIDLFDVFGNLLESFPVPQIEDGEFQIVSLGDTENVKTIEFNFRSSGAIDKLCFTPTPPTTADELAGLGDFVWHDRNANGVQDDGEEGIAGVEVFLLDANGGEIGQTVTDADGLYQFIDLPAGDYQVMFTQPTGFSEVTANDQGIDDAVDSDADPDNQLKSPLVSLDPGDFDPTIDAGFYNLASLGDYVWEDLDKDGIQDGDEPAIEGVVVNLYDPTDLTEAIRTTTTDATGFYEFTDLTPGDYQVEFVAPEGLGFTSPFQGTDPALDSNADPMTGFSDVVTLASGEHDPTIDAGLFECYDVPQAGPVWFGAGIQGDPQTRTDQAGRFVYDVDTGEVSIIANPSSMFANGRPVDPSRPDRAPESPEYFADVVNTQSRIQVNFDVDTAGNLVDPVDTTDGFDFIFFIDAPGGTSRQFDDGEEVILQGEVVAFGFVDPAQPVTNNIFDVIIEIFGGSATEAGQPFEGSTYAGFQFTSEARSTTDPLFSGPETFANDFFGESKGVLVPLEIDHICL